MDDEKELFLRSFEEKLKKHLDSKALNSLSNADNFDDDLSSVEYEKFRIEKISIAANWYEKACNMAQKLMPIKPDKKTSEKFEKQIYDAHLNCTPIGVQSLAMLVLMIAIISGLIFLMIVSFTIGIGFVLVALSAYLILLKVPDLMAKKTKTKANNQIIISVFYMVAFMRFNSNFELAVNFAANYLNPPLSLDFKRILWRLQNSEFPNIKTAMDDYLIGWRDDNLEFLESVYLIESSLYETENFRRISLLDKALDIILQGNYEKMLNFAQELSGKVTTFNMIGVVLPILGLIILPLAASFGDPLGVWQIVLLLYNIIIPFGVMYFGFILTFNRPSMANAIRPPENVKDYSKMQMYPLKISKEKTIYISPKIPAFLTFFIFAFIGFSPLILHAVGYDLFLNEQLLLIFGEDSAFGVFQEYKVLNKGLMNEYVFGPYGVYSGLLSLFIPLSLAFGVGIYLKHKYGKLVELRNATKKLELQFPSSMFQLGNRISEGISIELSFGAVAQTMKGTEAGNFFSDIDSNVKFEGMSVEKAIFDKKKGAINKYSSDLVISSMKILIRSMEKGPEIAAKTLIDLSRYLTEIHLANQRMKDLLSESLGSMKSQARFLGPVISGVVISIVSLITMIMGELSKATSELVIESSPAGFSNFLGESIPTFLFQGVVGVYIVMLVAILVYVVSNLEFGDDVIYMKHEIGQRLMSGLITYAIVVFIGIIAFAFIGSKVLASM